MLEDGTYTAVLDRLEGDLAVLVVEDDGRAIDDLVVPIEDLPEDGRQPDAVLEIEVACGDLTDATFEPAETDERAESAQDRFDRLARRPDETDGSSNGDSR